jgi:hypothetical protein
LVASEGHTRTVTTRLIEGEGRDNSYSSLNSFIEGILSPFFNLPLRPRSVIALATCNYLGTWFSIPTLSSGSILKQNSMKVLLAI